MDPKTFKEDANLGLIYNFNNLTESSFTPGNTVFSNATYSSPLFTSPSLTSTVSQNFIKFEYTENDTISQINSKMNVIHIGSNPLNQNGIYAIIFQGNSVDNKQNFYVIVPFDVVTLGSSIDLYNLIEFYVYPQLNNTSKASPPSINLNNLIPNSKIIHITNPDPVLYPHNTIVISFDTPLQVTTNSMINVKGMNPIKNTSLKMTRYLTPTTFGVYSKNTTINNPTMSIDSQIYIDCSPVSIKQDKVDRDLTALIDTDKAFGIFGDYSDLLNGLFIISLLCGFIIVSYYVGKAIYKTTIEVGQVKPVPVKLPVKLPVQPPIKPIPSK